MRYGESLPSLALDDGVRVAGDGPGGRINDPMGLGMRYKPGLDPLLLGRLCELGSVVMTS